METQTNYHNNAIKSCTIYKEGSTWYFDDKYLNVFREPFVGETNTFIDYVLDKFKIDKTNPTLIGSPNEFPNYQGIITKVPDQDTTFGVWYNYYDKDNDYIITFWFCGWLERGFFYPIPDTIYFKFIN